MSWSELEDQVRRRKTEFWWRDDDASAPGPALERALRLSKKHRIPLALAVIPEGAQPALFERLHEHVTVLQHGTDHRNRAAAGEKKTEYPGAEPGVSALERIARGREKLGSVPGFLPVLVPPWNRIRKDLLDKLPGIGIRGISTYGAQPRRDAAPGLRQVNTHVDIVAWRLGKRFVGEQQALSQALKWLAADGPVGWLTHHAMHDEAAWEFLERLFTLRGVRWLSAREAFSYTGSAHG
jgi:hypothetical protein